MFSFDIKRERVISPHVYVEKMEERDEEEEENAEMDTKPDEPRVFVQMEFGPSECGQVISLVQKGGTTQFFFKRECIPPTLLPFSPGVLKGLEAIDDLTIDQKNTLSVYTVLPIPVCSSPILALFRDNVPRGAQPPTKQRYVSWVLSAFKLRSFMLLVHQRVTPFHSSVSNEYPIECYNDFLEQIASYEEFHRQRIEDLIYSDTDLEDKFNRFLEYCEDFTYYYLHSCEHYLYKTLIEPHGVEFLNLEHFLTPKQDKPMLNQCEDPKAVLTCVVDFFKLKVLATQQHAKRHAGEDYVERNPFQLDMIPQRIVNAPPQSLYRGCIDVDTLREYFLFLDPKINEK